MYFCTVQTSIGSTAHFSSNKCLGDNHRSVMGGRKDKVNHCGSIVLLTAAVVQQASTHCVSLTRLQFGTKETSQDSQYDTMFLLNSFLANGSNFPTLSSWIWHGHLRSINWNQQQGREHPCQCLQNPSTSFDLEHSDPHHPVHNYRSQKGVLIKNVDSPLVVLHS